MGDDGGGRVPQVTLEEEEEEAARARASLAATWGWAAAELRSRGVRGTEPPGRDPETLALLRAYSEALLEMVGKRLQGGSAP